MSDRNQRPKIGPTSVLLCESGEVDWIFMLIIIAFFQLWQLTLMQRAAEHWTEAYQGLEDSSQEPLDISGQKEFSAYGQDWPAPLPRIDYGAHYSKEKDAKAICLVGRAMLLEDDLQTFRCE